MKTFLFAFIGLALALTSKLAGRFAATVRKVDPQSARWTISELLWLTGRFFISAITVTMIVLAVFLAPPSWATWTVIVGMICLVAGNLSLGALSGCSDALGTFLGRARRWTEIERLIRLKQRTRRALERFLIVILALSLIAGTVRAWGGTACAIVPDETASVRESSLQEAVTFIRNSFFDYVTAMNCTSVVVVRLGADPRFAKRTWLGPIPIRKAIDCQREEAAPLPSEASLFGWSRNVETGLKDGAVARCEHRQEVQAREDRIARENLLRQLDEALSFPQIIETSRVTEMVRYLTKDDTFGSVVVLSDLRDNPGAPTSRVEIAGDVSVVLIALPPAPEYGTLEDVAARIRFWEQNHNVTVLTVEELRPGLWSELARKRK